MTDDYKTRFFTEVKRQLAKAGIHTGKIEGESLPIILDEKPICNVVSGWEGVLVFADDYATPQTYDLAHKAKGISLTVREYLSAMEAAPLTNERYKGLDDKWKLLAEHNSVVLTGMAHQYGYQFATFSTDRQGDLRDGDYYTDFGDEYNNHYSKAKEAFALRAGLVDENRLFDTEQLTNLKTILNEYRNSGEEVCSTAVEDLIEKVDTLLSADSGESQEQGLSL